MDIGKFPFLRYPFGEFWANGAHLIRELVCSVSITMPVLVVVGYPTRFSSDRLRVQDRLSLILVSLECLRWRFSAALSAFVGAAARYYYDFTPILFVVAFCNLAIFWDRIVTSPRRKTLAKVVLSLLFIGNVMMGLLLGLTGTLQ